MSHQNIKPSDLFWESNWGDIYSFETMSHQNIKPSDLFWESNWGDIYSVLKQYPIQKSLSKFTPKSFSTK
jgi:hypothetical protein